MDSRRRIARLLGLLLLLLLAAGLRTRDIPTMSLSHPELFVPNIPLREGVSIPGPRESLLHTVAATLKWDTHPPGYYAVMWGVTEVFGTGVWALRLPSAVAGVAAVGVVVWLGYLSSNAAAGWLAGLLLAFHGPQILWSQIARMYSCTLLAALLSTALLLVLRRSERTRPVVEAVYVAVVLVGVSSHLFFWSILAVHLIWSFLDGLAHPDRLPRLPALTLLALAICLPFLAFSAYQSANAVAPLSDDVVRYAGELVSMALLWPMDGIDAYHTAEASRAFQVPGVVAKTALGLFGALLFVGGLRPPMGRLRGAASDGQRLIPAVLIAAAGSTVAIYGFVAAAFGLVQPEPHPTIRITIALGLAPISVFLLARLLARRWTAIATYLAGIPLAVRIRRFGDLPTWMAVLPFLLLATVASTIRPILTQRGLLFLAPFVLFVMARGLLRPRRRVVALSIAALVLLPAHLLSVREFSGLQLDPVNHRRLASLVRADLRHDDLIFLNQRWDVSPILYYLSPREYDIKAHDLPEVAAANPLRRVWLLLFYGDLATPDRLQDFAPSALGYRLIHEKTVPHALARCYAPEQASTDLPASSGASLTQ